MLKLNIAESATEARDNFFKLLRLAAEGKDVFILKNNLRFQLKLVDDGNSNTKKSAALSKMAGTGFKTKEWKRIEPIIDSRHNG